ncbi:MAG: hypothetical protein ACJAUD_002898 [Crocinitomicaceae bacterium]|jgi:hypothetical protein
MEKIQIKTFNPYMGRFPNDKVITIDTLALVKTFRSKGYHVEFIPDDTRELKYLFRKGDFSFFQDPFVLFLLNIPTIILVDIANEFIKSRITRSKEKSPNIHIEVNSENAIINNVSGNEVVSITGQSLNSNAIAKREKEAKKLADEFGQSFNEVSPYNDLPVPIFLEHSAKIIGWAKITLDDTTIRIDECKIEDEATWNRLKNSELRGASISGIADKTSCSICNGNYMNCNHISGEVYDSKMCVNTIEKARLAEISLVQEPTNSECIVDILNKNQE